MGMLVVLGAAASGAILFSVAFGTEELRSSIPWFVSSVMLVPVGFGISAVNKLNDLHTGVDGLTRDERRRLTGIVDEKLRQIYFAITFYVAAAVFALVVILIGSDSPGVLVWGVPSIGGLLFVSITSIGFLLAQIAEVSKFVGLIKDRERQIQNKRKLRAKTGAKPS